MSDEKTDASPDESQAKELDEDQLENVAGGAGGDSLPLEDISFNYSKIEFKRTPNPSTIDGSGPDPGAYPLAPKKK